MSQEMRRNWITLRSHMRSQSTASSRFTGELGHGDTPRTREREIGLVKARHGADCSKAGCNISA